MQSFSATNELHRTLRPETISLFPAFPASNGQNQDERPRRSSFASCICGGYRLRRDCPGVRLLASRKATYVWSPSWPTRPRSIPSRPSPGSRSPGRASPARWTRKPDHGETSYRGSGRLAGRKALITGGDFGHGPRGGDRLRARGRRCRDQLLSRPRSPTPPEVIALIKAEERIGLAIPGDLRDEAFCKELVATAVERARRPRHRRQQCRPPADAHASILDISTEEFDCDDEDQHLRAVLDHQGGAAAPQARLGDHRHDVRAGLRSVARTLRLRADQGGDDELRQVAGQAARPQGDPRQRRRARARSGRRCR